MAYNLEIEANFTSKSDLRSLIKVIDKFIPQ